MRVFAKKTFGFVNPETEEMVTTVPFGFCEVPDWVARLPLFAIAQEDGDLEVISGNQDVRNIENDITNKEKELARKVADLAKKQAMLEQWEAMLNDQTEDTGSGEREPEPAATASTKKAK